MPYRNLKMRKLIGSAILSSLALGLAGCENKTEQAPPESKPATPPVMPGPAYEPGPVQPSPTPSLPPTGATPAAPDMKPAETKTPEAKPEPPK